MLKPRTVLLLAAVVALSACKTPVTPKGPGTTTTASAKPGTAASVKPASTTAGTMLIKPTDASTLLSGKVEIDAHYLIGTGAGKIIGTASGNVIAAGGGNIIGTAAGNIIGTAAGNLIGTAAGNLIGKRKFDLLATAATSVELGATLPASEMEIQVFSLADGKALTLGVDAAGKAVVSVYSDAAGAFKIYLPKSISGKNVRVVAQVPDTQDTRLAYNLVAPFGPADAGVISEDTAVVSGMLREAFVSRLERLFEQNQSTEGGFETLLPAGAGALAGPMIKELNDAVTAGKVASLDPVRRRALARKTADQLLAYVDLSAVEMPTGGAKVVPTLVEVLREVREGATTKMRADESYFTKQEVLIAANAGLSADEAFTIKKPADFNDFLLRHVLAQVDRDKVVAGINSVLDAADVPRDRKDTVNAAMDSLLKAIGITMLTTPEAKAAIIVTIKAGQSTTP